MPLFTFFVSTSVEEPKCKHRKHLQNYNAIRRTTASVAGSRMGRLVMVRAYRKRVQPKTKNKPPPSRSLLRIFKPLTANAGFMKYDFDLGEREFAAIGHGTVHWAFLEEAMFKRTVLFARRAKVKVPADAHDLSFAKRLRALRLIINSTVKNSKRLQWWHDVLDEIGTQNGTRQKIVHGLWSYNARHPDRLFSNPRPSIGRWMTSFDVEKLFGFGLRVGELSYALLNPSRGGRPRKDAGFQSYINRSMLLRMAGKADALGFPQSIQAKQAPPPTPSLASLLEKLKNKED